MDKVDLILQEIKEEIEIEESKPKDEQWPLYLKTMKDLLIQMQARDMILPNRKRG